MCFYKSNMFQHNQCAAITEFKGCCAFIVQHVSTQLVCAAFDNTSHAVHAPFKIKDSCFENNPFNRTQGAKIETNAWKRTVGASKVEIEIRLQIEHTQVFAVRAYQC